ncbi:MAG: serine hydrolase [Sphingobium sp.]
MMGRFFFAGLMACALSLLLSSPLSAQGPVAADSPGAVVAPPLSTVLRQRAEEVIAMINGGGDVARSFAPAFLAQIPESQLRALSARLVAQLGRATGIGTASARSATEARLTMVFERGTAAVHLVVAPDGAGQIIGLRITDPQSALASRLRTPEEVAAAFAALPGHAGFLMTALEEGENKEEGEARTVAAVAPDRPLAIGSAFKLVILAELVRSITAGERGWDDLVALDGGELPAGIFAPLPGGTQVPLRGLAEAMIRTSDNSATDLLIGALGRRRIEAMQARIGIRDGAANMPFLTTMEAFKLKGVEGGALGRRYLSLDLAGRRRLLAGEVATTPGQAVGPLFADGRPVMIDTLEWFASPADLARVMRWLRDRGGTPAGAEALRILALNPGPVSAIADRFAYAGYKGGSEPGVLNMTLLLRDKAGRWLVLTASWNNAAAPVDEFLVASLLRRAAELSLPPAEQP